MNAPTYLDWAAWLATLGLVGGLIPVLAWLLARSIQGAVARQAIWRGSFLVIVCLSVGESGGIFHFESGITSAKEELNGVWKVSREEVTTPRESELKGGESGVAEQSASLPARSWWQSPTWLPGVVLLMGFGLCLTYWIVIRLGLAFYLRRYSMPTSVAVRESLMRIKGRMNYRGPCRLRLSKGRLGPFAFGTFFPTILVPSALVQQFSEEESCLVLAHEVGHFKNGDNLWRPIIDLVTFAFWWHPLVWWAQRELRMAGEFAADARAVGADFSAESLAECLVKFGRHTWMRHRLAVLFQNGAGFHSALGRRVERLLRGGPLEEQSLLSGLALSSGVMGLLVVGYLGFSRLLLPDLAARSAIGDVVFAEGSDSTPSEIIAGPEKGVVDLAERQPVINAADVGSVNPSEGAELQSRESKEASKSNASENRVDREQPGINEETRPIVNLGDDESRGFVTRRYRVDPTNFVTAARALVGDDLETEIGGQELQNLVRRLFRSAGVSVPLEFDREGDQSRPAIFFNERSGMLFVRISESEIDGLEELISVLN